MKAHSVRRLSSSIGLTVHAVRYLHEPFQANFDPPPYISEPIWDTELELYTWNYVPNDGSGHAGVSGWGAVIWTYFG